MSDSSIAPSLLVAMPQLLDPNFHRAVVLLIHHDADGTFGLVLNRATEISAPALCETLEITWRGDPSSGIDWGGPVQPNTGWVLFDEAGFEPGAGEPGAGEPGAGEPGAGEPRAGEPASGEPENGAQRIRDGLCFAGSLDTLRRVANDPPAKVRLLLGYAGWGPGQLESELSEGAWINAPLSVDVVFDVEADAMWEHVVRGLGVEPATLISTRGIH